LCLCVENIENSAQRNREHKVAQSFYQKFFERTVVNKSLNHGI